MGVSGSGKTLIGRLLAEELNIPFFDADDFHPLTNIEKMKNNIPLEDKDRTPWLNHLNKIAFNHTSLGCVIACSALKEIYRIQLTRNITSDFQLEILW